MQTAEDGPSDNVMTYSDYQNLGSEECCRIDNRVRQWAHRARQYLPNQHFLFVLVMAHLLRNAHTYFNMEKPSDMQLKVLQEKSISDELKDNVVKEFKDVSKMVREVKDMKGHNRLKEQKDKVLALKGQYGTFENISKLTGISKKTVFKWCSSPKESVKRRVELSNLRRAEYEKFLSQDTISFESPCKKMAGKRFLIRTIAETRKIYINQTEFHKFGILCESRMKDFRPDYIKLCSKTPLETSLCQACENCEKIIKCLLGIGLKCIPSNRFDAIKKIVCNERINQVGTTYSFPKIDCTNGDCGECGVQLLINCILEQNADVISQNTNVTWKKWATVEGRKTPDIIHVRGTIPQALEHFRKMIECMRTHIF